MDIHWLTSTIKENNNQHDRAAKKPCFKRQKDGRRQRAGEKQSPWGEQEKKQKLRDNPNIKQGKKQEENVANACALRYTGKLWARWTQSLFRHFKCASHYADATESFIDKETVQKTSGKIKLGFSARNWLPGWLPAHSFDHSFPSNQLMMFFFFLSFFLKLVSDSIHSIRTNLIELRVLSESPLIFMANAFSFWLIKTLSRPWIINHYGKKISQDKKYKESKEKEKEFCLVPIQIPEGTLTRPRPLGWQTCQWMVKMDDKLKKLAFVIWLPFASAFINNILFFSLPISYFPFYIYIYFFFLSLSYCGWQVVRLKQLCQCRCRCSSLGISQIKSWRVSRDSGLIMYFIPPPWNCRVQSVAQFSRRQIDGVNVNQNSCKKISLWKLAVIVDHQTG